MIAWFKSGNLRVDEARERCRTMLTENIDALHAIANALLERETISGDEIDILMRGDTLPPFQSGAQAEAPKPAAPAAPAEGEFRLEPVESAEESAGENTGKAESAEASGAGVKPEEEARPDAQAEAPTEPKKPANSSFSGHWDSFSSPSDRKDDK